MSDRVAAVEFLYESVVTDPERWNEQMFADWSDTVSADGPVTKLEAKYVRRALRIAQTLRSFWLESRDRDDLGWESRVDLALGPKAWRPILDLAQVQLGNSHSEECFGDVARLFPLVNGEAFHDGISFDEWSYAQER
jgi:hypothetical protein